MVMSKGIYVYESIEYGYASYIGKDSNIDTNKRWYDHKKPCMRNEQPFNKVLQDNFGDFFSVILYLECYFPNSRSIVLVSKMRLKKPSIKPE